MALSTAGQGVLAFLWSLYHSSAEGMPDKMKFAARDGKSQARPKPKPESHEESSELAFLVAFVLQEVLDDVAESSTKRVLNQRRMTAVEGSITAADAEEEEERAIASAAFALVATAPTESTLAGPGTFLGPIRYMGPGNTMELWWEYSAVTRSRGMQTASQRTFYRIFSSVFATHLKFRGKTEHATCDQCAAYKDRLRNGRLASRTRQAVLAQYLQHLASNDLDRQVSQNTTELSMRCADMLRSGNWLATTSLSLSVAHLDVDGVDQAKFRVPRKKVKSHAFESLIRPALHVQGVWLQGHAYQLAVSDADMMKNTNNNMESVARCLSDVYDACHGRLPLGLLLKQDNCIRECKNSHIMKFASCLVGIGVFRWVCPMYWMKGHTHSPLDGTFGQLCVKLSFQEFDDDAGVLRCLNKILSELGVDKHTREAAKAYKIDESADWAEWWDQTSLSLSSLTGPEAPHYFRFCRRCDLGLLDSHGHLGRDERECPVERSWEAEPHGEDVIMVVKARASSLKISQVVEVLAHSNAHRLSRIPQPRGTAVRRVIGRSTRDKVAKAAESAFAASVISNAARDYLCQWIQGTRVRQPRPQIYTFLLHRWSAQAARAPEDPVPPLAPEPSGHRRVQDQSINQ